MFIKMYVFLLVVFVGQQVFGQTTNAGGISCYSGSITNVAGIEDNSQTEEECDAGSVCAKVTASATFQGSSSISGNISYGQCISPAACSASFTCASVQHFIPKNVPVTLQNCNFECCRSNLCNGPDVKPRITTTLRPDGVRCDVGYKIWVVGTLATNKQKQTHCLSSEQCLEFEATIQATGSFGTVSGRMSYKRCVSALSCSAVTCASVQSYIPKNLPATITSCSSRCCSTYPCQTTTPSTPSPPIRRLSCLNGVKTTVGSKINDTYERETCDAGSKCLDMSASIRTFGLTGTMNIGRCVPSFLCQQSLCSGVLNTLPSSLKSSISGCKVRCCNENFCNEPIGKCGRTSLTASSFAKKFKYPIAGSSYENNMACTWKLTTNLRNRVIRLTFTKFSTERCCDYVQIKESGRRTTKIQGKPVTPFVYTSRRSSVTLTFMSDSSITGHGFELRYQAVRP